MLGYLIQLAVIITCANLFSKKPSHNYKWKAKQARGLIGFNILQFVLVIAIFLTVAIDVLYIIFGLIPLIFAIIGIIKWNKERNSVIPKAIIILEIVFAALNIVSGLLDKVLFDQYIYSKSTGSNSPREYFVENGIACEKFFNVSDGMSIETNEQVEKIVERIHSYCPGDVSLQDTVEYEALVHAFPQLKGYDFENQNFIHTYPVENNLTAYVFVKLIQ